VLGVGVGSGVYELEPPRERDELPPVIFLNVPETFRPKPFMMKQNKHVQLEIGYVSEIEMNILTHELFLNFLQQRNERERFLKSKLSKNPMKTRKQILIEFERE